MNIKIEKEHNKPFVITENNQVLSLKSLIIEARVREPVIETRLYEDNIEAKEKETGDFLKIILTFLNDSISIRNNKEDNITLDMKFGGNYALTTYGSDDDLNKRIIFSVNDQVLGRIQYFRYEIDNEITYGRAEMKLILT